MSRWLLGVSGGIAAYKGLETARLAVRAGHAVRVVQTVSSTRFVGTASFAAITGAPVLCGEFDADPLHGAYPGEPPSRRTAISHLALAERAELFLIAPASANTIAKLAHGQADNLLTAAALVAACPVAVAPAMNHRMYLNPATQANLELLAARGVTIIAPGEGELASHGEYGIGRLADPAALLEAGQSLLDAAGAPGRGPGRWLGARTLITAGGTREPIDSVRYIGNRSSGRMGWALAREAARRGAEVTLVAANVGLDPPTGVRTVRVSSAAELAAACAAEFEACDVLLMAAAVADFRPSAPSATKLKKDQGPSRIDLEPTEDVLSALAGRRRPGQILVGFAAEHGIDAVRHGREKLARKRLDAMVVNDISQPEIGFDAAENEVTVVLAGGRDRHVARTAKARVAACVLDEVEELLAKKEPSDRAVRADPCRAAGV